MAEVAPAPPDAPRWSTAPHITWAPLDAEGERLLVIDVPGGLVDRTLSHPDVTSVVNDRFAAWFLHPHARPDLTARYGWPSITALAPDDCVRMTTTTAHTPASMIEALNDALVARSEQRAEPAPGARSWPEAPPAGGDWTLASPETALPFTTARSGAPAVVIEGTPFFFGGRSTARAAADAGSAAASRFLESMPPGASVHPNARPSVSCSR